MTTSSKVLVRVGVAVCAFAAAITGSSFAASLGQQTATVAATSGPGNALSVAIEYYHAGLDHYFLTADPVEIDALASGKFLGWARTGQRFAVLPADSTNPSSTPVCRFYASGLNTHFYSAMPAECDAVRTRFPDTWQEESADVYRAFLPDNAGSCPSGTQPVYRLYNDRADVNHRYTTDAALAQQMKAKGYVAEGYGSLLSIPVALCAPVGLACALTVTDPHPTVGSQVTIASACTGNPNRYIWSGCSGQSDACSAGSSIAGTQTYGLVAVGPTGTSEPAAIAIEWKAAPSSITGSAAQAPSCTIATSNAAPSVGSTVTLSVLCTVLPTSYQWTGCASASDKCTATSATAGVAAYSVSVATSSGAGSASTNLTWQGGPIPRRSLRRQLQQPLQSQHRRRSARRRPRRSHRFPQAKRASSRRIR